MKRMKQLRQQFPADTVFLVTGGAGFIGSNLCEAILNMGCRVRCLDNLSTGRKAYVDMFCGNSRYEFIRGDIRDEATCLRACEGVAYVLNQAAWGSVPRSMGAPLEYLENNVVGQVNMLEAARRQGVRRFVYASSSSVYGDDPALPKREGQEGRALSPYALTKQNAEAWAKQYTLNFGLFTCGLRYFNVFGRRQNPRGAYAAVIPRWIGQLTRGEEATIFGDGSQSRDFTYVDNVIEANLLACLAPQTAAGEAFNIACGERRTLLDVYRILSDNLGAGGSPVFLPGRRGDIPHSLADITRARNVLQYEPVCGFQRGIEETAAWYKAHPEESCEMTAEDE